jgi:predicted PurR-regulated permease PerM
MAVVFHPIHVRVEKRISSPGWAAALSTVLMLLLFLTPLTLLIITVSREVRDLYQSLGPNGVNDTAQHVREFLQPYLEKIGFAEAELRDAISGRLTEAGAMLFRQSVALIGAISNIVVFVALSAVIFFFAIRDGARACEQAVEWSPLGRRHTRELLETTQQMIMASFYGVVAVSLAQGLLCGFGVWITGLPSPLLWGVVAAIGSVIPFVGSSLAWLPAALTLFMKGSIGKGIFLLAWGAGVVGTIDNVVRPLVVTAKVPVSTLLTFIAMLGGVQAFGLIGILIGPVTLAVGMALIRIIGETSRE